MMDFRSQRDYYRTQRRAFRRQRRGYFGGIGGIIWLIIILSVVTSHWFWALFPLLLFGIPFFFWIVRPMLFGNMGPMNQQQPYVQPGYQQPEQQEQPYAQPQYEQPVYQPYTQGYAAQSQPSDGPHEAYQESSQPYQYQAGQQQAQQYEEPMTMYPQE